MDSSVLKRIIINNQLIPNFLIFIENEPINGKAYIDLISKKINKPIVIYDSVDNAIYDITTGLVSERIYYILNDNNIIKETNYIQLLKSLDEYIIIGFNGIKIPDNFLNDNSQFIYTFNKGDINTLISYIHKKYPTIKTSNNNLIKFIEACDYKLSQINNELDKVVLLSIQEQEDYFILNKFPDIRIIDNMKIMLMIINKNKDFIKYINILINSSVQSLLAIYTMARKKFIQTNDKYYARLMVLCFKTHSSIIDGTEPNEIAIKKFAIDILS